MKYDITLLLPTRKRPHNLKRFYDSIQETADNPDKVQVVVYIDDDDDTYDDYEAKNLVKVIGSRIVLSKMWNRCYEEAKAPILGHMGDDIVFRSKGWDTVVKDAINAYDDKIVFVYGDDGGPHVDFGTHGFIHKNWVDAVGYFVPPYFSSDYNDTWLNDVAKLIKRHQRIDIYTEHMHPAFNKAPVDSTHTERLERHARDDVGSIYYSKSAERQQDADKLREVMQ